MCSVRLVQEGIAALLATQMEEQAQLLAFPDLLHNHPELRWEQAAAGSGPSLGTAKELFVRDRKLTDFRWVLAACTMSGCSGLHAASSHHT